MPTLEEILTGKAMVPEEDVKMGMMPIYPGGYIGKLLQGIKPAIIDKIPNTLNTFSRGLANQSTRGSRFDPGQLKLLAQEAFKKAVK